MQLSSEALKNFKKNPNKIFFYDLEMVFDGVTCEALLEEKTTYLIKKDINSIAINMRNSVDWIMWYLAADAVCRKVFLISTDFNQEIVESIYKKFEVDLLIQENKRKINNNSYKNLDTEDRIDVIFTSGTSGIPKAAMIGEKSFIHVAKALIDEVDQKDNDLELLSMSLDRSFGLARLRTCILSGCAALVTEGMRNFPRIYEFSKKIPITGLSLVPSALQIMILQLRKKAKLFTRSVKYVELGSSMLVDGQFDWIKENFEESIIIHHYGMTESSRAFIKRLDLEDMQGSQVGKPLKGVEYKLYKQKKDDKHGELLLRGKNLFLGYLDDKLTEKVIVNGWDHTGDVCFEKKQKIYLVGRTDNQMNIGGAKVQAEMVERVIEEVDSVNECICFEYPDNILGNTIAVLMMVNEENIDFKRLFKNVFSGYPSFYFPSKIAIVESLPKTFNGKKQRDKEKLMKLLK